MDHESNTIKAVQAASLVFLIWLTGILLSKGCIPKIGGGKRINAENRTINNHLFKLQRGISAQQLNEMEFASIPSCRASTLPAVISGGKMRRYVTRPKCIGLIKEQTGV